MSQWCSVTTAEMGNVPTGATVVTVVRGDNDVMWLATTKTELGCHGGSPTRDETRDRLTRCVTVGHFGCHGGSLLGCQVHESWHLTRWVTVKPVAMLSRWRCKKLPYIGMGCRWLFKLRRRLHCSGHNCGIHFYWAPKCRFLNAIAC